VTLARYLAVLAIVPGIAHAAPCVKYGAGAVSGTVHRVMFYGPPNYGEDSKHDERGFYPVLKLDRSLRMCADRDMGVKVEPVTSHEMQMIFYTHLPFNKALYGKHVTVRGELLPWETANHHTPVMLGVSDVRVTP
jgi:hypothetical protein